MADMMEVELSSLLLLDPKTGKIALKVAARLRTRGSEPTNSSLTMKASPTLTLELGEGIAGLVAAPEKSSLVPVEKSRPQQDHSSAYPLKRPWLSGCRKKYNAKFHENPGRTH
ncbi:MAG: hypothetical protein WA705_09140 [Candidatus Ozemobacteraceae bacterium]